MVDNVVISGATEDTGGSGLKSPDSSESSSGQQSDPGGESHSQLLINQNSIRRWKLTPGLCLPKVYLPEGYGTQFNFVPHANIYLYIKHWAIRCLKFSHQFSRS